jgi:hypothetical protein
MMLPTILGAGSVTVPRSGLFIVVATLFVGSAAVGNGRDRGGCKDRGQNEAGDFHNAFPVLIENLKIAGAANYGRRNPA